MNQVVKKGDTVRIVHYTTPIIGNALQSKVRILESVPVIKAGDKAFSVQTKHAERRFKQADIGSPVEGNIRQSFLVVLTEDMSLEDAIQAAKDSITKALNSRIDFYQKLIAHHQEELSREIPVTNASDDE